MNSDDLARNNRIHPPEGGWPPREDSEQAPPRIFRCPTCGIDGWNGIDLKRTSYSGCRTCGFCY